MAGNIARAYVHEHIISNTIISRLWKLNMADCGREREEQTSRQNIEVIAVIERTCAEIKEIRKKYSINHQQQQYHGTQNKVNHKLPVSLVGK